MLIESRPVKLTTRTGIEVRRTIPHANLKMIGPWCFADHFGPTPQTDGMVVATHPHTGLQTVTWLIEGAIEHRDSIGSIQRIQPGELNLMTAGNGISHSELSLKGPENLHAVQLWVALPEESRHNKPDFEHQGDLPKANIGPAQLTILAGEFADLNAPTKIYSPMVGVEIFFQESGNLTLDLNSEFEYGVLLVEGSAMVAGEEIPLSGLHFQPAGSHSLQISATSGSRMMLLGGEPFEEKILMWWNFIGRNHDEIAKAREQWNARDQRFGEFEDLIGGWIPAPEMPNVTLKPNR